MVAALLDASQNPSPTGRQLRFTNQHQDIRDWIPLGSFGAMHNIGSSVSHKQANGDFLGEWYLRQRKRDWFL